MYLYGIFWYVCRVHIWRRIIATPPQHHQKPCVERDPFFFTANNEIIQLDFRYPHCLVCTHLSSQRVQPYLLPQPLRLRLRTTRTRTRPVTLVNGQRSDLPRDFCFSRYRYVAILSPTGCNVRDFDVPYPNFGNICFLKYMFV